MSKKVFTLLLIFKKKGLFHVEQPLFFCTNAIGYKCLRRLKIVYKLILINHNFSKFVTVKKIIIFYF